MSADLHGLGALDAEHAALTLPGVIPGLLRRCSPVRILGTHPDGFPGTRGVCTVVYRDGELVGTVGAHLLDVALATLALDLTDATGRAHAAWWLASRIRHIDGSNLNPAEGVRWHRSWRGYWELHCQRADEHRRWQEVDFVAWDGNAEDSDRVGGPHSTWTRFVPSLATLDPNDPRLLPDGSRWVDAEALRRVCLHVAGLEVTP